MRTLDVIEFVVAHNDGVTAQEISNALSIPMSSLSYLLGTLADRGYLCREGRRYSPGPGLDRLRAPNSSLSLEVRVTPLVRSLLSDLNETVSFMVRDGWNAKTLVTEAAAQALRYAIEPGEAKPLHTLAAGKVILASMANEELDAYFLEAPREQSTKHTIVDEAELRAQLKTIRDQGYAEAIEESTPGICSIGAKVIVGQRIVGAIGIAVPTIRFTDDLRLRARQLLNKTAYALAGS